VSDIYYEKSGAEVCDVGSAEVCAESSSNSGAETAQPKVKKTKEQPSLATANGGAEKKGGAGAEVCDVGSAEVCGSYKKEKGKEEVVATTAVSESQMEKELSVVWDYYLEAFDKEEALSPSAKKMGLAEIAKVHKNNPSSSECVHAMTCVIDMARHIVNRQPKKAYFADWHKILSMVQSLGSQYDSEGPPRYAELPEEKEARQQQKAQEEEKNKREAAERLTPEYLDKRKKFDEEWERLRLRSQQPSAESTAPADPRLVVED
jgi:hypothetical protein